MLYMVLILLFMLIHNLMLLYGLDKSDPKYKVPIIYFYICMPWSQNCKVHMHEYIADTLVQAVQSQSGPNGGGKVIFYTNYDECKGISKRLGRYPLLRKHGLVIEDVHKVASKRTKIFLPIAKQALASLNVISPLYL